MNLSGNKTIIRELNTAIRFLPMWLTMVVIIAFSSYALRTNYIQTSQELAYNQSSIDMAQATDAFEEVSELEKENQDLALIVSPYNYQNNSLSFFFGISMLLCPIFYAMSIGTEYRNNTIKLKVSKSSLPIVVFSKLLILSLCQILFSTVYCFILNVLQRRYSMQFGITGFIMNNTKDSVSSLLQMLFTVNILIFFFCALVYLVSLIFKSSIPGLVTIIFLNYFTIPGKYSISNISHSIISRTFRLYENGFVNFPIDTNQQLESLTHDWCAFGIYFLILFAVLFFVTRKQKN